MIFLGYWSLWFLVGLFLAVIKKIRFTDGNNNFSILAIIVFSFIMAVPSSLVHCAFIR